MSHGVRPFGKIGHSSIAARIRRQEQQMRFPRKNLNPRTDMDLSEIEHLMHEVDKLYAYQPYQVTKSIIERVKAALKELAELKTPWGKLEP